MGIRDETTEQLAPERSSSPNMPLVGRKLGKFTLVGELGKGGSGEVFRAEERELGRTVVVKVLRRDVARKTNRVERFLREVKLASRLDHPYAAHVYAFGAESDGVVWIAMEHVRGMTLDSLVATRGAMPPTLFAPLFERLCEVVHTAHELGIVHRDIKGSNVMVVERAGKLLPKLLDFGIAKGIAGDVSPGTEDSDELTAHGAILGSPHYMAPEQWASAADVDARADIYALGVLAYYCLAGAVPFAGTERAALPQAHREQQPPPLPRSVPAAAATAIERALAKSPDARWQSALAFGEAIRDAVGVSAPEPVPLLDPTTRDVWIERGPQPIADAVARLSRATTTVEADAALYELIAIACRWFATVALSQLEESARAAVREQARAVVGRDDAVPWLLLARAAATATSAPTIASLAPALVQTSALEKLAARLDDRDRHRTAATLAADVAALPAALRPLEPLLDFQLVVGRADSAESWRGARRRDRERVVVWGEPLGEGEVALLDREGRVVTRLSPLVQVSSPLPSAEPELFLLWRTARGGARLVAAPWGYERDDEDAARWLAVMTTADTSTPTEDEHDRSPYPGLASYDANDAAHFVGREREVEALINRMVAAPCVAVLGASGAGKTSFVQAGVIPRLADGYAIIKMRPGRHPLRALSAQLLHTEDTSLDDDALVGELRERGEKAMRGLVIVIDQLEELMTLCSDADERHRFAVVLARAAHHRDAPVRVVATLRDDFANVVETLPAFRGRFELFVLATPAPDALRRIITEPARRAQVSIDPEVVDDMVREVEGRVGSLPLLSFTAAQLWQSRDREARKITRQAYDAIGGVAGALSTYADQVHDSFAPREQDRVRVIFSRLVATDGTRIPTPRAELEALPGTLAVLPQLVDARLLVVREDAGVDVVEVVHECLATRWDRLARWRSEDAAERVLLADLRVAARRWSTNDNDPDLLWRGEPLAELRKLAASSSALTGTERAFAYESDRVANRTRRTRRMLAAGAMIMLAGVAVTMAYLRTVADDNRRNAEQSADDARDAAKLAEDRLTASLIAQGKRELNDGQSIAALAYFGEVLQRGVDTPGLRFMIGVARRSFDTEVLAHVRGGYTATALVGGGFAASDNDGKLKFWDDSGKLLGTTTTDVAGVSRLIPQGDRLLAIGAKAIGVVDVTERKLLHRVPYAERILDAQLGPGADELSVVSQQVAIVFGLDGKERRRKQVMLDYKPEFVLGAKYVFAASSGSAQMIDMTTWQVTSFGDTTRFGPAMCPDRKTFVYLTATGEIVVLDANGTKVSRFKTAASSPLYAVCSETGDRVGVIAGDTVHVHDRMGKSIRPTGLVSDREVGIVRLIGDEIWTGAMDGTIRRYYDGYVLATLTSHAGRLHELRVSKQIVVSRSEDGTLVVTRGDAAQNVLIEPPCEPQQLDVNGNAVGVICGDTEHIYIGNHLVAAMTNEPATAVAFEPTTKRAAIASHELRLYDGGKITASSKEHTGLLAFEDGDRVIVAERDAPTGQRPGMWRWTFATNKWERIAELESGVAALAAHGGVIAVANGNRVRIIGKRTGTVELPAPIVSLAASAKLFAAQLATGQMILFEASGKIVRELEPLDSTGVVPIFDATGTFIIRPQRHTLSIWDATSGDKLVDKDDMFKYAIAARFADDGSGLEYAGSGIGKLVLAADKRPRDVIARELACRVPLRVAAGGGLEARDVKCN